MRRIERKLPPVIYLALFVPAAALPALLMLDRLERWAVRHRGGAHGGAAHRGPSGAGRAASAERVNAGRR